MTRTKKFYRKITIWNIRNWKYTFSLTHRLWAYSITIVFKSINIVIFSHKNTLKSALRCWYEYQLYGLFYINFPFTKLWILRKTTDFLIPGKDYLSRFWHNFLEFLVLNALQLCTCLALYLFWSERHWWVLCRRNSCVAYLIIILLPLITNDTCTCFVFLCSTFSR